MEGAHRVVIDDTYGAGYIGAIVTAMLYGLTTLQTYFYYVHYPRDPLEIKGLVSVIWVLDSLHVAFVSYCMYHYLVTNYANPPALAIGHWSLFISVGLNVLIAFIVQVFFTRKIHIVCRPGWRWFVTPVIGLVVLAHFCLGVETVVFLFIKKELARLPEMTLIAATPFAIAAVLSDILIAAALCILLHGGRTGHRGTNTIVTTLIIYSINRCLLTSVVAIVEVIAFSISPHTLWYLAIDFVIGKLYANSLLATLNSRQSIKAAGVTTGTSIHLSDIEFRSGSSRTTDATLTRDHVIDLRHGDPSRSHAKSAEGGGDALVVAK